MLIYLPWLAGALLVEEIDTLASLRWLGRAAGFAWPVLIAVLIAGRKWLGQPQLQVTAASTVYYLVLAAALGLILVRSRLRNAARTASWLDHQLGLLSYPLYLIHGPAIVLTGFALNASGVRLNFGPYLAILLATGLSAGFGIAYLVEKPVLKWRRRLLGGTSRAIAARAAAPP